MTATRDLTEYLDRMSTVEIGEEVVIMLPSYTDRDTPSRWLVRRDELADTQRYLALSMLLVDAIEVYRGSPYRDETGHGGMTTAKDAVRASMLVMDRAPILLRVREAGPLLGCLLATYTAPYLFARVYAVVTPCVSWSDAEGEDRWQLTVETSEESCPIHQRVLACSLRDELTRRRAHRQEMPRSNREVMRAAHTGFLAAGGMRDKIYRLLDIDESSPLRQVESSGKELACEVDVSGRRVCPVYSRDTLQRLYRLVYMLDMALRLRYDP
jgi:hypothetical protein